MQRVCSACGKPLPDGSDVRRAYCNSTCRSKEARAKTARKRLPLEKRGPGRAYICLRQAQSSIMDAQVLLKDAIRNLSMSANPKASLQLRNMYHSLHTYNRDLAELCEGVETPECEQPPWNTWTYPMPDHGPPTQRSGVE